MVTVTKKRLINPHRKVKKAKKSGTSARRTTPKKANPGALYVLGMANPHRGTTVAKKTKKKNGKKATRRPNPFFAKKAQSGKGKRRNGRRRYRNPMNIPTEAVAALKFGLIALLGLVATRQVPQTLLGEKNQNWLGYLSNLGTAVGGGLAAGKFVNKEAAVAFLTGGGLYTVNRVISEKLTPVGRVLSMSGLGDPMAARSTMGRVRPTFYPPAVDRRGNLKLPQQFVDAMGRALPPTQANAPSVSGLTRIGRSRVA